MALSRNKPKSRAKTERKREVKKRALSDVLRRIVERPDKIKVGGPSDYTPEACNRVIALMERGLSLTAAAGAMGITRSIIHEWIKTYPEFSESVERGKAKRVLTLESQMLDSSMSAIINARRIALANAAPEEWRQKQVVDLAADSPIRSLAQQLMGTAIRPQLPEPKTIEHVANEPRAFPPQAVTIAVTDVIEAEPLEQIDDADDDAPRIHTISSYYQENNDEA